MRHLVPALSCALAAGCAAASPTDVRRAFAEGRVEIAEHPSPPLPARLAWYLPNRLLDLADLIGVELHVGPGVGGHVVVTRAIAYGFTPAERAVALGVHGREAGLTSIDIAGESLLGWRHKADLTFERRPVLGSAIPLKVGGATGVDPDPVRDGWLDVEVAGHVALAGLAVKVRAGEMPDLLAGLALLDPSGDDRPRPVRVTLEPGLSHDVRHLSPGLAALVAGLPGSATLTARPLHADASGDAVVRLGIALETRTGRRVRTLEVVRVEGRLAIQDERTRLSRPWLR